MRRSTGDRRVRRTRKALVGAFNSLIFEQGYRELDIDDLRTRAGVGRSTFYEHFRGKDAILVTSLAPLFGVLADCIRGEDNTRALVPVLKHFWENRRLAREVFDGSTGTAIRRMLIRLIDERLPAGPAGDAGSLPRPLLATQLAAALLAPLTAWLMGECHCTPEAMAQGLRSAAGIVRDGRLARGILRRGDTGPLQNQS